MPPVNDNELTDLASLRANLDLADDDIAADTVLERLIKVCSATFKRATNRPVFIESVVTQTFTRVRGTRLLLPVQPVSSVSSVSGNGSIINPYSSTYRSGYEIDQYGIYYSTGFDYGTEYTVVWTGGFELTSNEALMAEQAVISMATLWWKRKDSVDQLAQSLGNQITAKFTPDPYPADTLEIIRRLRRMMP